MAQQSTPTFGRTVGDPAQGQGHVPRILRIGIVQNGKIVEERLVRKRADVTVGQSDKNTFVVPASSVLPRSFTLFQLVGDHYALNFTDGVDGRIAFDQSSPPATLVQLRAKAQKKDKVYQIPLSDKSRGKVVMGDLTVLFQFVAPPPIAPRPQLPPSVRGSITQNLDWIMIAVAAVSFVGHFGFVFYLRQIDFPRKPDIEEIPDRFVQMIVQKKEEPKKPDKVDPNAGKKEEAKQDKGKKSDDKNKGPAKPRDPEAEARAAAERRARIAEQVKSMGALKILGAKGEGGSLLDTLRGGDPGGDADKVFEKVGGVGVAGTSGTGLGNSRGAAGTGTAKGIDGLRATGPGNVNTGERAAEKGPKGLVKDSTPVDIDGSLDPNMVVNEIRKRKGAIVACYERALKRNPNLAGKLELQFTISAVGKVTGAEIGTDTLRDDEVGQCITSIVRSWRFPAPEGGGEVHFSYPFVFTASK